MSEAWYDEGLKFHCIGCGDCCTGAPGYVWVTKAEIAALAAALGLHVEEFERQFVRSVGVRKSLVEFSNGDCALFDGETRRCRVYDARPRQCRTWPFWPSNLSSPAAWERTAERCPGCNRGRRIPLGRILAQLEMVRV
jgi:Fe-S-cluster containining protein